MLQIGSGKLFTRDAEYRTNLKGVIYSNLRLMTQDRIETETGSIEGTSIFHDSNALIFTYTELIEALPDSDGPGFLASHGISSYIGDFSAILSFALNCTASPSYSLVERLLSDEMGISTHAVPNKVVNQTFDKVIYCQESHKQRLINFTQQLHGLNRKTFLAAMSAIRTYVTGIHRIADNFELAYTLLVASIESLAQEFDGHQATWDDYEQRKRRTIDEALTGAEEELAERVRNAILRIEHVSLGKRFQAFTINHINPSFFREESDASTHPITRFDLPTALNNAYLARSKYVHTSQKLPKPLDHGSGFSDTCRIDNKTWLTIQGLARLARHVINEFIMRQQTIASEPYDYSLERNNTMIVSLAPQHWIYRVDFKKGSGVKRFEGFLSQLAIIWESELNEPVSDLSQLLTELQTNLHKINTIDKVAFICLFIIYNSFIAKKHRILNYEQFVERNENLLIQPSSAVLVTRLILQMEIQWSIEDHHSCLMKYFKERDHKFSFRCPQLFESGMLLQLAERYRTNNDLEKAKDLISLAVESYPEHQALRKFENEFISTSQPIDCYSILIPSLNKIPTESPSE